MKTMYVYILTNYKNTVLYVGVTGDLVQRIWQHKNKVVKSFSSRYNLGKLVYYEIYADAETAIKREKTLKLFRRQKKIDIITQFNPLWRDLYDDICK